ncbi:hypothetical protein Ciccas_013056 [Cichlidogyrus casuarinus]|uniref:Uncharacterized protein n=1 Tax=Cichlidogyrus casuarinus TaxID=1844966 RepID=A0ABD2PLQ2_9PLAT
MALSAFLGLYYVLSKQDQISSLDLPRFDSRYGEGFYSPYRDPNEVTPDYYYNLDERFGVSRIRFDSNAPPMNPLRPQGSVIVGTKVPPNQSQTAEDKTAKGDAKAGAEAAKADDKAPKQPDPPPKKETTNKDEVSKTEKPPKILKEPTESEDDSSKQGILTKFKKKTSLGPLNPPAHKRLI